MEKQSRQSHYRLKVTLLFRGEFESLCRFSSSRRGHLNARLPLRGCQLQAGGNGQPQPRRGRPMLQLHLRHVVTVRRIYHILEETDTQIGCAGMDVSVRHNRSSASGAKLHHRKERAHQRTVVRLHHGVQLANCQAEFLRLFDKVQLQAETPNVRIYSRLYRRSSQEASTCDVSCCILKGSAAYGAGHWKTITLQVPAGTALQYRSVHCCAWNI